MESYLIAVCETQSASDGPNWQTGWEKRETETERDGNVAWGGETGCRNFAFYGDGRLWRRQYQPWINKLTPHTYRPSDRRKDNKGDYRFTRTIQARHTATSNSKMIVKLQFNPWRWFLLSANNWTVCSDIHFEPSAALSYLEDLIVCFKVHMWRWRQNSSAAAGTRLRAAWPKNRRLIPGRGTTVRTLFRASVAVWIFLALLRCYAALIGS